MQNEQDNIDNQKIIRGLIKGDKNTFEKIYKSYFASIKSYSSSIVGDSEIAYEITQNIFVTLWENRKRLNPEKSLRNYLLQSAYNNSLRHLKTQSVHNAHKEIIRQNTKEEELRNVMEQEASHDSEKELRTILNKLPKRSRQVITMSYLENKKNIDIANELSISIRTVESILYQTMRKLQEKRKL